MRFVPETGLWLVDTEPHVAMRIKRLLDRVSKNGTPGHLCITATDETARDLLWISERYPMEISEGDRRRMEVSAGAFDQHVNLIQELLLGKIEPRAFTLAIPPREYQRIAAEAFLQTKGLLLADDIGLGKTASAIAALTEPATRPALVVTLTHLTTQWAREITKFAPGLSVHIVKKGKPYPVGTIGGSFPDVLIMNYHKLSGWSSQLAGQMRTIIFDEVQELRTGWGSQKYDGARKVADAAVYRIGLSVGPKSFIELVGGPFGVGWSGTIEDAYEVVSGSVTAETMLGYDFLRVGHLGIRGRGWIGERFGWKPVRCFIRHGCDKQVRTIFAGGRKLVVTDDHAVYLARGGALVAVRGDRLVKGDIIPADDGHGWLDVQNIEHELDVIEVASGVPQAQVVVDLSRVQRVDLGLTAWQWQNCHREASYGTRLPIDVFLRYRNALPDPTAVYVGRGRAPLAPPSVKLSEWAYVLGFFIGDGWVDNNQRVSFAVDLPNVAGLVSALRALPLGLRPKVVPSKGASVEVRCSHRLFAEILVRIGISKRCFDKVLPGSWVMSWPETARRALLQGLLDSDGHEQSSSRNRAADWYVTTSPSLAASVHGLLRSLGVLAGIHVRPAARGGIVHGRRIEGRRPSYQVFSSRNALNGINDGKRGLRRALNWSKGHFNEAPVRSNTRAIAPVYVYDLEMVGHPSFVADGLLVHNSATPVYNYGGEFFNVMEAIRPGALGDLEEFNREWCLHRYGERPNQARVRDPVSFGTYVREVGLMIRRTRAEVRRELPEIMVIPQHVDADPKALDRVSVEVAELARLILRPETEWTDRGQAARDLDWKLRQATGIGKAPYVAAFVRLLVDSGEQVLLYGWHREVYAVWMDLLKDLSPVMFTGSESSTQKDAARDAFVEGRAKVLVMSLRAGQGIDGLQAACRTVVFGELDWSPGVHNQCAGRIHRDGQKDPVSVYYLVSDSGSDPVVSDVLGIKRMQIDGLCDPTAPRVEAVTTKDGAIKKLAADYLGRRGEAVTSPPSSEEVTPMAEPSSSTAILCVGGEVPCAEEEGVELAT